MLGNLQSKEENLQSINLMKQKLKDQEAQLAEMREGVKAAGSLISEGIS